MASLREIKDHIASVRSTLKITSAMKLVASAKLRKAQQAAEGIRPYTAALSQMLSAVLSAWQGVSLSLRPSAGADPSQPGGWAPPVTATGGYGCERDSSLPGGRASSIQGAGVSGEDSPSATDQNFAEGRMQNGGFCIQTGDFGRSCMQNGAFCIQERVAIVAVASNSSLCGAFNINVVHRVQELVAECKAAGAEVEVISVGRKMAEAMRKMGFAPEDHADLVGRNSFEKSSAFAQELIDAFNSGRFSRILLVYNHFVSTASQKVQVETYLPFASALTDGLYPPQAGLTAPPSGAGPLPLHPWADRASGGYSPSAANAAGTAGDSEYILEPSREEILATLLPQVMRLRIHTVLLDSIAAEHAARMLAMQAASDNAEDLLSELTLEYNKGRQQKITSEILDLVGGAQQ